MHSAKFDLDHVRQHARVELDKLASRLGLMPDQIETLHFLFNQSLEAALDILVNQANAPYVPANKEARAFLDYLEELIVNKKSHLIGEGNLGQALEFMANGGNVLLVQNHTSGADTIVMDYLVNQRFNDAAKNWILMAGHVINLFLLPLTISGAMSRVQIFSAKYCQHAGPEILAKMREQNARALGQLAPLVSNGGILIGLYPEGGRGEGTLKPGEVRTMKIPQLLHTASPKGLMILPSYVLGATSILPVVRGDHEFEQFLTYMGRGSATVEFGPGVMWEELQPKDQNLSGQAVKQYLIDKVMRLIAAMAPTEEAKGPYI